MKRVKRALLVLLSAMMIGCVAAFVVACGGGGANKPPQAVTYESLSYDGSVIRWDSVEYAKYYTVTINGSSFRADSTMYTYPVAALNTETIDISVKAVNDYGESEVISKTFHKLPTIMATDITFDEDGTMTWPAIAGASGYTVEINGTQNSTAVNFYPNTEFPVGQRNTIRVKANGADSTYFADWSTALSKTYLAAPRSVSYDGQLITWQGIAGASEYTVFINGSQYDTTRSTSLMYDSQRYNFSVEVRAEGDGNNAFRSALSEIVDFVYLDPPTNVHIDEGVLVWDPVDGATGYDLKINGSTVSVTECRYEKLAAGAEQRVQIKPRTESGSVYFSDWTSEETYFILKAPELQWNGGTALDGDLGRNLVWNAVAGNVSGYNIRLTTPGGQTVDSFTANTNPSFQHDYLEVGEYCVAVQSVPIAGTNAEASVFSTPIYVVRLAAPAAASSDFIVSNPNELSQGFTVNYKTVSGATGYRLYKNGGSTDQTSKISSIKVTDIVDTNTTDEQQIQYQIQSIGYGLKTEGGKRIVTLDSLTSASLIVDITVLAMPRNLNIDGTIMTWDSIQHASSYAVNVSSDFRTATNSNYNLTALTSAGNYPVSVCSQGNGREVLPSFFTPEVNVIKLEAPQNLRVLTDENEGTFRWDPVLNARSVNLYMNGLNDPIEENMVDNISKYIGTGTCTVVMEAVANYWSDDSHKTYYLSSNLSQSQQFTKLQAPTFPNPCFTNTEFIWEAPSNFQTGNISYRVYDGEGFAYNGQRNGTRMDISNLQAGAYTFSVKAIGDGYSFVNSDMSEPRSITKLDTPTVTHSRTAYEWYGSASATSYTVWVEGKLGDTPIHDGTGLYTYKPGFTEMRRYSVEVYAVGDGGFTTIDSDPFRLTQEIKQLVTPVFTVSYTNDSFDPNAFLVATVNTVGADTSNIVGYKFEFNGTAQEQVTEATEYRYSAKSTGAYVVSVTAIGGVFDDNGDYWINSRSAGGDPAHTFTLLARPNQGSITVSNMDGVISWSPVTSAGGYEIEITYTDGTTTHDTCTNPRYSGVDRGKTIQSVKIRALGNGTNSVHSEWVTWTKN